MISKRPEPVNVILHALAERIDAVPSEQRKWLINELRVQAGDETRDPGARATAWLVSVGLNASHWGGDPYATMVDAVRRTRDLATT